MANHKDINYGRCTLYFGLITLGLFLALTALVYVMDVTYHGGFRFQVDSLTVPSMTIKSNNTMTADFNVALMLKMEGSPNLYDDLLASVEYKRRPLASTTIQGFTAREHDRKEFRLAMGVRDMQLSDIIADSMLKDLETRNLELVVRIRGLYFPLGDGDSGECRMKITCNGIKVGFSPHPYNSRDNITGSTAAMAPPIQCKYASSNCNVFNF